MRNLLILLFLVALPALASEPGQPLDCSDWVFLEPGLSCTYWIAFPCPDELPWCAFAAGGSTNIDSAGSYLRIQRRDMGPYADCQDIDSRVEIVRFDGVTEQVIAYVNERCCLPGRDCEDQIFDSGGRFNERTGELLIRLRSDCGGGECGVGIEDYDLQWSASIQGFATTFEILQTYLPSAALAFRVPYMPEGFQYADYFDTYYGDLATVGEWSQAQPLQCAYPATPPDVGDHLTVADTLPTPGPGHGYYYVTAVTYQGATRYGRKCVNGVLSGRDPAVLPGCE